MFVINKFCFLGWGRAAVLLVGLAVLQGCSATNGAIALDSMTTHMAMQAGGVELNPLLKLGDSSLGVALGVVVLSTAMTEAFPDSKPAVCRAKYGASANNLAVLAGAGFPESLVPAAIAYAMTETLCAESDIAIDPNGRAFIVAYEPSPARMFKVSYNRQQAVVQAMHANYITVRPAP